MQTTKKIYNLQSLNFIRNCKLKIGILGGSFNPAHDGHLRISLEALKLYNFDYIIWLVALQNPLKKQYHINIFNRAKLAAKIAVHPKIIISTAEYDLDSCFAYESLSKLCSKFSKVKFTWIMGMDNIAHFHQWYKYDEIAKICDILIFDRPDYHYQPYGRFQNKFKELITRASIDNKQKCAIMMHHGRKLSISSSKIREILHYAKDDGASKGFHY